MRLERASTEKHLATDMSDESESVMAAPSDRGIEETSSGMPQGHDDEKVEAKSTHELATTTTLPELPTPPNGGSIAWLQVLGGFFVYFNTWWVFIYLFCNISVHNN